MPAALLFRDGFARANAATLGANYANSGPQTWSIASNQASITNPSAFDLARFSENAPYGVALTDAHVVGADGNVTGSWGVYARESGFNNFYHAYIAGGTTLQLFKVVSGVATQIGVNATITRVVGALLELKVVGSVLNVWYNNTLFISQSDAAISAAGFCGLVTNTFTGTALVNRLDVRGDDLWSFIPNKFDREPEMYTELAEYDSGFVQRNRIWQRARYHFTYGYEYLLDADVQNMEAFWQKYAEAVPFLVQDPTPVNAPATEILGIGDGTTTAFKAKQDKLTGAVTVTVDGAVSSPSVDNMDALVIFATAPLPGAVIRITSGAAYWRVRFKAKPKFVRYPPNFWRSNISFLQDKSMISGVPV